MSEKFLYQTEEGQELLRAAVAALDGFLDGDLSIEEAADRIGRPPPRPHPLNVLEFPAYLYPEFPSFLEDDPKSGRSQVHPIKPNLEGWWRHSSEGC